jgi:hypothetical protein
VAGRILFGLDRLPRGLAVEDPRLPGVPAGGGLLRLNTDPLPPSAMTEAAGDHPARLAALRGWLEGSCGDYARPRRRFVAIYLDFVAAELARHRAELEAGLARFDGLYVPEDWLWSAPRPLPRAWLPTPDGPVFAEIAFRLQDGPLALVLAEPEREAPLRAAGIAVCRIDPDLPAGDVGAVLGPAFVRFWTGERLPRSPFRRPLMPAGTGFAGP